MSDSTKPETKDFDIYTVEKDALAAIEVSGAFYKRITGLYFNIISKFSAEEIEKLFEAIAQKKINELEGAQQVDAFSIETLLILMASIEGVYKENDNIKQKTITVPIEPPRVTED